MMSDRIAVMHQGRMWQVGTPREVYAQPCNLFVSRFLGVSNELPGQLRDASGEDRLFQPADGELPGIPVRTNSKPPVGGPATLSLRPEQIRMSHERPITSDPVLPGLIEKTLFAGSDTKYLVRIGRGSVWEVRTTGTSSLSGAPGDRVFVQWALADGRLFFE